MDVLCSEFRDLVVSPQRTCEARGKWTYDTWQRLHNLGDGAFYMMITAIPFTRSHSLVQLSRTSHQANDGTKKHTAGMNIRGPAHEASGPPSVHKSSNSHGTDAAA